MHAQQIGAGTVLAEASAPVETSQCDSTALDPASTSAPAVPVSSTAVATEPGAIPGTAQGE